MSLFAGIAEANSRHEESCWSRHALSLIETDQRRSADTHLIRLDIPAFEGIYIYLKDESTHPTGSLKHRLARSLPSIPPVVLRHRKLRSTRPASAFELRARLCSGRLTMRKTILALVATAGLMAAAAALLPNAAPMATAVPKSSASAYSNPWAGTSVPTKVCPGLSNAG
jgi:hypothetical protein